MSIYSDTAPVSPHFWDPDPPWVVKPTNWRAQALCRTEGHPDDWFPPSKYGEESLDHPDAAEAAVVCRRCPVRKDCLEAALVHDLKHGIFAATTPKMRQRIVANRRRRETRKQQREAVSA